MATYEASQFIFDDLLERDVEGQKEFRDYDLIFAKEYKGVYTFRGVFLRDDDSCRMNHHVSKLIATRVKVIGKPADHSK